MAELQSRAFYLIEAYKYNFLQPVTTHILTKR